MSYDSYVDHIVSTVSILFFFFWSLKASRGEKLKNLISPKVKIE